MELLTGTLSFDLCILQKTNSAEDVSVERKRNKAKTFLSEMKKSLSQVSFEQIVTALQSYKTSDSLEALLSKTAVLTEDANTHGLFRGVSFVIQQDNSITFGTSQRDRTRRTWRQDEYALSLRDVPVCPPTSQETV